MLREDLRTMGEAIVNYTMYEEQAPQSLKDFVRLHYLYEIPCGPGLPANGLEHAFCRKRSVRRTGGKKDAGFGRCLLEMSQNWQQWESVRYVVAAAGPPCKNRKVVCHRS